MITSVSTRHVILELQSDATVRYASAKKQKGYFITDKRSSHGSLLTSRPACDFLSLSFSGLVYLHKCNQEEPLGSQNRDPRISEFKETCIIN